MATLSTGVDTQLTMLQSSETTILNEIQDLQGQLRVLLERIEKLQPSS